MKVKVCGLTQKVQVEALAKMGVHYAGFIFYPKSPRYVLNVMTRSEIKSIDGSIQKVGVFVNESLENLIEIVASCSLDIVQLHGDESPGYCRQASQYVKVIKAFQVRNRTEMLDRIAQYKNCVDLFLFDTPSPAYGGTGEKFDWNAIADLNVGKSFLLSGGISAQDVDMLETFSSFPVAKDLHAIDINSRFETKPGVKDLVLLEKFLKQLKDRNYVE
ncbi:MULTISPECIES: phosphoribosylanthranilate isomerase [Chitinophagaceae]